MEQYAMHIRLRDLIFFAYIGVFEQEQSVGAQYIVNLDCQLTLTDEARRDKLGGTVSYADLYELVSKHMSGSHALLESVCCEILDDIRKQYPQVKHAEIEITKVSPPISGMQGSASVQLSF